ncbi:MAG: hypothetical protein HOY79_04500 [Streptomyces sp.]|nr:hypothetical protein [Streptomyces sp.]NUS15466.1 hypothetical protein [Streptomyces sp.]NUS24076.1 hypothetical protein [Streptomyces sp.]
MPKSRKRRNIKPKPKAATRRAMTDADRAELVRRLTTPLPGPRPKHFGYAQTCPQDQLIDEFGEDGASWLQEEYQGPLSAAEFRLEQCIRRDEFVLDDPFTGPDTTTAEKISRMLEATFQFTVATARQAGTLTDAQEREAAEVEAQGPIDHAADSADVVREAFQAGVIFLNDRNMWDLSDGEDQHA